MVDFARINRLNKVAIESAAKFFEAEADQIPEFMRETARTTLTPMLIQMFKQGWHARSKDMRDHPEEGKPTA